LADEKEMFMNERDEYKATEYFSPQGQGAGGYSEWPGMGPAAGSRTKTEVIRPQGPRIFGMLVVVDGPGSGQIFRLNPMESNTIGRDYSCEIVIDEPAVSRQHAKIKLEPNDSGALQFFIQDLATENGIEVNGQNVIKHYLKDGDQLKLGRALLVYKQA
jgi:hypothetical protein